VVRQGEDHMLHRAESVCLIVLVGAALLMGGCGARSIGEADPAAGPQTDLRTTVGPYRLRPGDRLLLRFLTAPGQDLQTTVTPNGTIIVPTGGEIRAGGATLAELKAAVEEEMGAQLLDPSVAIVLTSVSTQPVYVIGEVGRPGRVEYTGTITVTRALAAAGGPISTGKPSSVMVVRAPPGGEPEAFKVDVTKVLSGGDLSEDVSLQPDDIVYVPKSVIGKIDEFVELFFKNIAPAQLFYLRSRAIVEDSDISLWE